MRRICTDDRLWGNHCYEELPDFGVEDLSAKPSAVWSAGVRWGAHNARAEGVLADDINVAKRLAEKDLRSLAQSHIAGDKKDPPTVKAPRRGAATRSPPPADEPAAAAGGAAGGRDGTGAGGGPAAGAGGGNAGDIAIWDESSDAFAGLTPGAIPAGLKRGPPRRAFRRQFHLFRMGALRFQQLRRENLATKELNKLRGEGVRLVPAKSPAQAPAGGAARHPNPEPEAAAAAEP